LGEVGYCIRFHLNLLFTFVIFTFNYDTMSKMKNLFKNIIRRWYLLLVFFQGGGAFLIMDVPKGICCGSEHQTELSYTFYLKYVQWIGEKISCNTYYVNVQMKFNRDNAEKIFISHVTFVVHVFM
jgi:hypothetical protein